mmetsp:Transcript_12690/g.21710  ORF Transcript_12690/g.21710 Transcript_12690/m.21710 type:complete len:226 (-) Transcript_12690:145-822(-)
MATRSCNSLASVSNDLSLLFSLPSKISALTRSSSNFCSSLINWTKGGAFFSNSAFSFSSCSASSLASLDLCFISSTVILLGSFLFCIHSSIFRSVGDLDGTLGVCPELCLEPMPRLPAPVLGPEDPLLSALSRLPVDADALPCLDIVLDEEWDGSRFFADWLNLTLRSATGAFPLLLLVAVVLLPLAAVGCVTGGDASSWRESLLPPTDLEREKMVFIITNSPSV